MRNKKNTNTGTLQEQTGSISVTISAKAIVAAQQTKRKRSLVLSCVAVATVVSVSLFMLNGQDPVGEKLAMEQNAALSYFNEWPAQAANVNAPTHTRVPFVNSKLHTHAESTQINKPSQHSLMSVTFSKKRTTQVLQFIQTELMDLNAVSFHPLAKTAAEPAAPLAMVQEPAGAAITRNVPAKKNMQWFVGLGFNPQLSNYQISKNTNSLASYTGRANCMYVNNLRNQSKVYSYNASLKGGFVYKDKWMVQASAGYQSFRYLNRSASPAAGEPVSMISSNALSSNTFNYVNCTVEMSHLFDFKDFDLKTGVGFSTSCLAGANAVVANGHNLFSFMKHHHGAPLNKWTYAPGIHVGVVKNLSGNVQMQASPNLYYNLNSMFNRNYLVTQKPYGVGLDLSLLIRIN